jgi:FtsH-binding integral membrane protein
VSLATLLKRPSAFLPLAMSLAALAVVIAHVALVGTQRQADEGAAAHLWQLLMAAQLPIILFFAARWLPQSPRQALLVLTLQLAAALAAAAPVFALDF